MGLMEKHQRKLSSGKLKEVVVIKNQEVLDKSIYLNIKSNYFTNYSEKNFDLILTPTKRVKKMSISANSAVPSRNGYAYFYIDDNLVMQGDGSYSVTEQKVSKGEIKIEHRNYRDGYLVSTYIKELIVYI